ncbi:MAG: gliding motility-associated C-terminal domain-containing protein [Flavobacteriales bacterium]|nr:gliding motility-associated C-terminal domain-containing protein [Flavobacteriales bacterium]
MPEEVILAVRFVLLFILWATALLAKAGSSVASLTENRGQWPDQVLYRVLLPNGALFVERSAFTYVLQSGGEGHQHGGTKPGHPHEPYRSHAFRVHFEGGAAKGWEGSERATHYENHFIGNDPDHWGTHCPVYGVVTLWDVWPGVDLRVDGRYGLKYEFILAPGADPDPIRLRYEGQDALALEQDRLVVRTTAGQLIEEAPVSFHTDDPRRGPIATRFMVAGSIVSFHVGAFDPARPLTIDPELAFASYSGSTGNNFGFTATYDDDGHLYGAGIVFAAGYPTTLGVLDGTYNGPGPASGPTVDIGVSKWSPDGASLIWSTYIGGQQSEAPHSMVVNANDELYIFGHTGSADFPTTPGCFDNGFSGGPALIYTVGYGFDQPLGTDMYVVHLNADASALIGSTYVGGGDNDGVNNDPGLAHNYGDAFRGEIIVDASGNPTVASTTASTGLQTLNASQGTHGGGVYDGYCFRLNPGLTTLLWATYVGGSSADAAYGAQVASTGEVFVTGGTTSTDLPMFGTPFSATHSGGIDGFIMRYAVSGSALGSTFIGTAAYDQSYFVQLDTDDKVYVVGQSGGSYPVTTGHYVVPGSSQFIHKFATDLASSEWSTVFGNGNGAQYLSPTAFLVSDCGQIYFSGWGGSTNAYAGNSSSTTLGMAVTADAFQSTTDGNDFYLMVLEPEAIALNHATYFGGNTSPEHVDGGTSRFDKNGTMYQAVCAGCQGNDDFPTTPGAWGNTNGSTGCNLGVIKFDLVATVAIVDIVGPSTVCAPAEVQFTNNSIGGDTYEWDLGDGTTSTETAPQHAYSEPGSYTVSLRVSDSAGCARPDSTTIDITVIVDPPVELPPIDPLCPGDSVQVNVTTGVAWSWSPTEGVSDPTASDPTLFPSVPTSYTVTVTGDCGQTTADVFIDLFEPNGSAGPDVLLCVGETATLNGAGGGSYDWQPAATLNDPSAEDPVANPIDSTMYTVSIITPDGCEVRDSVVVLVDDGVPIPLLVDTIVCAGEQVQLIAPTGRQHLWMAGAGVVGSTNTAQTVQPGAPGWYAVQVSNACGSILDSAFIDVRVPAALAWPDSVVCAGQQVPLFASEGTDHVWSPATGLSAPTSDTTVATVTGPVTYTVTITDELGCVAQAQVQLGIHPTHAVTAYWDQVIELGSMAQLQAVGEGSFVWAPAGSLSDSTSATPVAQPQQSTTYTVTLTDVNGCITTDEVTVLIPGRLFIPNTFTPNGDGYNDAFGAWGVDIVELELDVFNRWGTLIWSTADMATRWDGRCGGQDAPIDTYVWKVRAKEVTGGIHEQVGHVNLVR